jgi:hypothetical protein
MMPERPLTQRLTMMAGGFPIPPAVPQLRIDGSWPPRSLTDSDSGSHAATDTILGARKDPSVAESFQRIIDAIMKTDAGPARGDILGEVTRVQESVETYLGNWRAARKVDLEQRRDSIYRACRIVKDHVKDLQTKQGQASSQFNAAAGQLNGARAIALGIESQRPVKEDFPSRSEIETWQRAVAAAQAELDVAQAGFDERQRELAQIERELTESETRLAEYSAREQLLAAQIDGREWRDEHGLVHPPEEF